MHQGRAHLIRTAFILSLIVGAAGDVTAQALTKVTAGYVSPGAQQWPQYVARELGWFKEAGIDLDLVNVGAGAAQQLTAGSVDIASSGFPDFVRAADKGAPIKIMLNAVAVSPYSVYGKPSLKSVAELKGKTVSVGGPKDVTLIYMKALLASANLKLTDIDMVFAKQTPDRFAALAGGAVDAAIINPPSSFRASSRGFTNLGDIEPYLKDFPFTVWAVNLDWAAKNRDAVVKFSRAYTRGVRWLYDPKNKDQAIDILIRYSKQDKKDVEDTYDFMIGKIRAFSEDGRLSDDAFEKMMDALLDFGDIAAPAPPKTKLWDGSYADAADKQL